MGHHKAKHNNDNNNLIIRNNTREYLAMKPKEKNCAANRNANGLCAVIMVGHPNMRGAGDFT